MPELSSIIGVPTSPISATGIIVNLTIGAILSFILMLHYNHFSHSLSNRAAFSRIFPLIILTTLVVITIVKSSLALSLGLVGALSIVRFRTPIKEPEELAYLFISIAVGLGLGADQKVETNISFIGIIIAATIIHWINLGKDREIVSMVRNGRDDLRDGVILSNLFGIELFSVPAEETPDRHKGLRFCCRLLICGKRLQRWQSDRCHSGG